MDDPLRQKSVPLAAETVLWFEFLIDPNLLTAYLNRSENGGPRPIELINQFLAKPHATHPVSVQSISEATTSDATAGGPAPAATNATVDAVDAFNNIGRKQFAQKLLSLKVAAHLRWDLALFERELTLQKQVQLLSDLCSVTAGKLIGLPIAPDADLTPGPDGNSTALRFAITLYHRWLLRTQFLRSMPLRLHAKYGPGSAGSVASSTPVTPPASPAGASPNGASPSLSTGGNDAFRADTLMASLDGLYDHSVDYLQQLIDPSADGSVAFVLLTYDTFRPLGAPTSAGLTPRPGTPQFAQQYGQTFDVMLPVSRVELRTQIHHDLCLFFLHRKQYAQARTNALACQQSFAELHRQPPPPPPPASGGDPMRFCSVDEAALTGCLNACGLCANSAASVSLLHRLTAAALHNFDGVVEILREDNVQQSIPLVNRRIIELDIEAALARNAAGSRSNSPGRSSPSLGVGAAAKANPLLMQVAALNALRAVTDRGQQHLFTFVDFYARFQRTNSALTYLAQQTRLLVPDLDERGRNRLRQLFVGMVGHLLDARSELPVIGQSGLFAAGELATIHERVASLSNGAPTDVPTLALRCEQSETVHAGLDPTAIKRQLIAGCKPHDVRTLLHLLAKKTQPVQPLWTLNPTWVLPVNVHTCVMQMPPGFIQDCAYILVAKSKELCDRREYVRAQAMIMCLKAELPRSELAGSALGRTFDRLLDWEIINIQLGHATHEWPRPNGELALLGQYCEQVMRAADHPVMHEDIVGAAYAMPRMEIVIAAAVMQLNLGQWSVAHWPDKRFPLLEMCATFAAAAAEAEHQATSLAGGASSKKVCRDVWELVLPMFSVSTAPPVSGGREGKSGRGDRHHDGRNNGGAGNGTGASGNGQRGGNGGSSSAPLARDSPSLVVGANFIPFLKLLRGLNIITIALSLLSHLHNLLKDDQNMEIHAEHSALWPASLSNISAYSHRVVVETLSFLLQHGRQFYPHNLGWLRLSGEFEFVNENNEAAMTFYVSVLVSSTEYCTQRPLHDDHMTRRMVRASMNLGCNVQAAILCQFLEEIDYALAFKCITERTTFKNISDKAAHYCDAMDAFYGCVWDITLLEYIVQQHCRKGENKRKQQAIALMGQLELNLNNHEEIRREAAATRQKRFLRALAKQYML